MIMKKTILLFAGIFFLLLSMGVSAQIKTDVDYFAGKWNVVVENTPEGDAKMLVTIERVDGKLSGTISSPDGPTKFSSIEEKENSISLYFVASGYDVYLNLEKKGDNNIAGTMLDMFDAKGERVIE